MKLLKTLLSAALLLCMLLSLAPCAFAEDDPRFAGKSWDEVVAEFNERLGIGERNVGYGYRNAVTGEEHFFNPDQYMVSASMYKVPLNMAVSERVYEGTIGFDTLIGGISYQQLQDGSIVHSDNEYARVLWMYVGNGNYRSYRRYIAPLMGEDADTVDPQYYVNNFFTPRQMIHCLTELYDNQERYPGVIDCMKRAEPTEYFRRSENRYEIAHKYGYWEDTTLHMNDCAIVYTDEPILIVCFTDGLYNAYQVLAEFCTLMCDYAQYELEHREPAEGAKELALEGLSLPRLARTEEPGLPIPEPTPAPTPEPTPEPFAPVGGVTPWLWVAAALLFGLLFVLSALGRRKLRRRRALAGVLSLLLALGAGGIAVLDLSPLAQELLVPAMSQSTAPPALPDVQEAVMGFFDALELDQYGQFYEKLDGWSSLGLEEQPGDALGAMTLRALRESYSYRLEGESRTEGTLAEQEVTLRSLSIPALEQALRESAERELERLTGERGYRELCDENGLYRPEIVQEAIDSAAQEVFSRAPEFYREHRFPLRLIYSGGWYVRGDEALLDAVQGN